MNVNVIDRLNEHASSRGVLAAIARASGLSFSTIQRISAGTTKNPGIGTVSAIEKALDVLYGPSPFSGQGEKK